MHSLSSLFRPNSVAIVGATEKAMWTGAILRNFPAYRFEGALYAVNRQGVDVLGVKGYPSCVAIGKPVDAAYIIVPVNAIRDALADVASAGIKTAVVLTSGFAEAGPEGAALQEDILAQARAAGIRFLGPNSLGFANIAERKALTAIPPQLPLQDGAVGLISQSGATTSELMDLARRLGVGLSFAAATGNEAMIGIADMVDFLAEHEPTRVIAVYCETVRDTAAFGAAARKAQAAGKPIVMIKVGSSALSAAVAAAHTGSLVGDNRVFEAACTRLNIVRVSTVEDLIITSGFMASTGRLKRTGIAIVSVSGGACAMSTDIAEPLGVEFPVFAPSTAAALRAVLPAYAATLNPLDATGAVMADPGLFERTIKIISADEAVGCVFAVYPLPDNDGPSPGAAQLKSIGAGLRAIDKPGFLLTQSIQPVNEFGRRVMQESGIERVLTGIEAGFRAVAGAARWSARLGHESPAPGHVMADAHALTGRAALAPASSTAHPLTAHPAQAQAHASPAAHGLTARAAPAHASSIEAPPARPATERETLEYLATFEVPVIPAVLVRSAEAAAHATGAAAAPVVLKIASPDIAHKSDVGGVKLGVSGAAAAAAAYEDIMRAVIGAVPQARIDGVLVSPMRTAGVELFVGIARDPQWGPVIVVGLGGIWVEVLKDTVLSLLPVSPTEARRMLESLRGAALLNGYRGSPRVDVAAAARAIARIGDAALALGPRLATLEVNPLLAYDGKIEALDGLAIWNEADPPSARNVLS